MWYKAGICLAGAFQKEALAYPEEKKNPIARAHTRNNNNDNKMTFMAEI